MSIESLKQIHERLNNNGFKPQIVVPDQFDRERKIVFIVSAGKKEYNCTLYENEIDEYIINSEIEKYNFIAGYQAIWSKANETIECEFSNSGFEKSVQPHAVMKFTLSVISKFTQFSTPTNFYEIENIKLGKIKNISVSLGLCSQEFAILSSCRWVDFTDGIIKDKWTLKLTNIKVNTHDEAYKLLLKVANSLFFRIDMLTGFSLVLNSENENRLPRKSLNWIDTSNAKDQSKLLTIKREYDDEAMAYYWYAKNAVSIPLLQYLAYYQVIEFYFPFFEEKMAKEKLKVIIKNLDLSFSSASIPIYIHN